MTSTATRTLSVHLLDGDGTSPLTDKAACGRTRGAMISGQYAADHAAVTCLKCLRNSPSPRVRRAPAAAPAVETPAPAATGARTWDASTATSHVCAGACGQELPATSYPTTGKPGQRGVVCRKDRDAARTAR